ncbi:LOW QUALITY PROTEIN: ras and Rab interactor 1 [Engraulis encrasicolus]|uniref:LOW QUALITY PROTEIN: ras and Rab interactor 1 n=1 Tax=Engraulis encrasicolus TaxID=184585 RepID=UPI002FD6C214
MDSSSVCGVQRSLSVLDRLLLTHSIWLQLSVATDTAVNILQREPVGTFMVCKCVSAHKKVLCVRIGTDNSTSAVKQHRIREEESTFALEGSALSFPDLCRLVAFYCVSRDVLPFPLELPETIAQASSHTQLEAISHLGSEFWSSQTPPPLPPPPLPPPQHHQHHHRPTPCFINPLFLQPPDPPEERAASSKRHRFRRSLRVRVSTETSLSLSSGGDSGAGSGSGAGIGAGGGGGREQRQQLANHTVQRMLKRSPAMSPTSEEEDEIMAQHAYQDPASGDVGSVDHEPGEETSCTVEDACLSLQTTRAPSLAALDSNSSFSSLEEDDDDYYETGESTMSHHGRSILTTATTASSSSSSTMSVTSANSQRPSLKRMSAAFVCLFAPERRVARLVLQLSRDPRSAFGALVQEFLCGKRAQLTALQGAGGGGSTGNATATGSAAEALQGVRKFLTQAKGFLLGSGELEPPIETLVPENEKDLALEKAMFGCVLKPLRVALDKALQASATNDGSLVRLSEGMRACQPGCPRQKLGVPEGVGLLDCAGVSRARRKLALMSRSHSPIDKVLLLLQVCKRVYQSLGTQPGQDVMSEHFLPALAYVLVHCNMPQLLLEVQYMMELLEPSWLTGEGGYYLTSTYASLCLIQSHPQAPPVGGMTSEAQEKLREWSQRRGQERYTHATTNQNQRLVRVLYQEGGQSVVRTLHWAEGEPASSLALSCATAFAVSQPQRYGLFCRALAGEMKPLPPNALIHDAHAHSDMGGGGLPSLSYLRVDHDAGKVRRLTRGGAVDLGGSVCEE